MLFLSNDVKYPLYFYLKSSKAKIFIFTQNYIHKPFFKPFIEEFVRFKKQKGEKYI